MLNRISGKIALALANRDQINGEEMKEVYQYGIEWILTSFLGICSILILSAIFSRLLYGVIFICFFCTLRMTTGGFHANTYLKCFIISNISFFILLCIFLAVTRWTIPQEIYWFLLIASALYIGIKGTILHKNQPLSQERLRKNHIASRIIILTDIGICLLLSHSQINYMVMAVFSICLTAILMITAELQNTICNYMKGGRKFMTIILYLVELCAAFGAKCASTTLTYQPKLPDKLK